MSISLGEKVGGFIQRQIRSLASGGFFHILTGGVMGKLLAFVSSLLIVRFVTKDSYALLAYADNIYSYITIVSGLGMASGALKFCSGDDAAKNEAFLGFAMKWGTLFQLAVAVGVILWVTYLPLPLDDAKTMILILVGYPFLTYWISLYQSYLRCRLENKAYALSALIQTAVVAVLSVAFVFTMGIYGVVGARYIACAVALVYLIKKVGSFMFRTGSRLSSAEKKDFLVLSLTMLVANFFSLAIPLNEAFLVNNLLADPVVIANYKVASLFPAQVPFIASSLAVYYFPLFAKMKKGEDDIWGQAKKAGLVTFALVFVVCVAGCATTPFFIKLFYGEQYVDATWLSMLLWIVYGISAAIRMLPMNLLPAVGYSKFNMIVSVVACCVHFALDFLALWLFGIYGAAFATALVYLLSGVAYWVYLRKKTT